MRARFDAALMADDPYRALGDLQEAGLFYQHLPEVEAIVGFGGGTSGHKDLWDHTRRVVAQCPRSLTVRWAALFHDVGKPVTFKQSTGRGGKVSFHGHEAASTAAFERITARTGWFVDIGPGIKTLLEFLGRSEAYSAAWEDGAVRRLSRDVGPMWDELIALTKADCTTGRPVKRDHVQAQAVELDSRRNALVATDQLAPALPTGLGNVLIETFDRRPGKWLGDLMDELRARVDRGDLPRNAGHDVYVAAAQTIESGRPS